MSKCNQCNRNIFGDDLYEMAGKVYCEDCAKDLAKQSTSASPTGFGCISSYLKEQDSKNYKR